MATVKINDNVSHALYGDGTVELVLGYLHCLVRFSHDNLKTVSTNSLSIITSASVTPSSSFSSLSL